MGLLIVVIIIAAVVAAYRFRVPILARVLGQPEDRIRRQLGRKRA
jgi:hypothetical protein